MTIYSPFTNIALTNWANGLLRDLDEAEVDDDTTDLTTQLMNINEEMKQRGFNVRRKVQYWKLCARCGGKGRQPATCSYDTRNPGPSTLTEPCMKCLGAGKEVLAPFMCSGIV